MSVCSSFQDWQKPKGNDNYLLRLNILGDKTPSRALVLVQYFTSDLHAAPISLLISAQHMPQFQINTQSKRQLREHVETPTSFIVIVHCLRLHPCIISVTRVIHISFVHLSARTKRNKLGVTTSTVESVRRFFLSLRYIWPCRIFKSLFHFLHHDNPSITAYFHFSYTFSSSKQRQVICIVQEGITRDTELTTKCSWLNSFWSCFSNSAFSSDDFCKEFKASSSNSRFRVALIFSPGSTIPLAGGEEKRWLSLRFHLFSLTFDWLLVYYPHCIILWTWEELYI